ncbi:MAG: hypothetical protein U0R19_40005 [Bryobacteraceae bacterium]
MKRTIFSEGAEADIRAIPQHIAMNILMAIHIHTVTNCRDTYL